MSGKRALRLVGSSSRHAPQRFPLSVFVLIDALGWQIIKGRPFLNAELPVRFPLKTVLGYSSGAIPTILSGLTPAETGRWNLLYHDPAGSPFRWLKWASLLPDGILDNRYTRKIIKELGCRVLGMGPLFECAVSPQLLPYFNWTEKGNIYGAGGIAPADSIFDRLQARGVEYRVYSYHHYSDEEGLRRARAEVACSRARYFFVYLSELDHFLHEHRDEPAAVTARLAWYEARLRTLFAIAGVRDPSARLTIFSDHGMTPVHSQYDLAEAIAGLGFTMPRDYLAVYDSTMARYWFFTEAVRHAVRAQLERTACGRILTDAELAELGLDFADRRHGELIFLLNPGWIMANGDFNRTGRRPAGMHGYHPDDPESDAIFLSNQRPAHPPRAIADLFHWLVEDAPCYPRRQRV